MAWQKLSPRVNPQDPPPFWELGSDAFEELCCDLLSQERGISRCELFGVRRQEQFGIDLKAWRDHDNGIEVAQCKAQKKFTPAEIRNAGKAFLDHWDYWRTRRVRRFILIVACDLRSRQCHQAIEDQEELFKQRGIAFEAWSNRMLVTKLAPHEHIVTRRFVERPDYWVRKICGREMPHYVPEGAPAGALAPVLPGITALGFAHLAHRVSEGVRRELEVVRDLARRGKFGEAQQHLRGLTSDRQTWPFLEPEVHALALRLKTGLALERGDITGARKALQELEPLGAPDGIGVLRAAIVHHEEGTEEALEALAKESDPDSRRLEAALLIETGEFEKAIEALEARAGGSSDAEILRLRAVACLYLGEGEEAFSAAQAALGLQPEWLSVRITFAMVGYFTSLSPIALPEHAVAWPQPVSWALVRRDDESAERRRRAAEEALKALEEADLDSETRRLLETLRLACLASDPERREEAEAFCQELVRRDRLHVPAIAWALGRGFRLDLAKSRKALEKRFNTGHADLNQTISLVACHLRDDRRQQAENVLVRARPTFEKEGQLDLWLIQEAQVPSGRDSQGNDSDTSRDLKISENGPLGVLADVLRAQERQDPQILGRLAQSALEKGSWPAFVEACEVLARHGQWLLLSPFARELVEVIGTADAARIAALAMFNQGRHRECLELLSQAESLFPGRKLSADLRRLQVQTLTRLGRSTEAIELAEQVVREEPAPEHLLDLVDLYWAKGDVPGAAFHARALGARPDLPSEDALRTAARIVSADPEVARDLLKKAVQAGVPDELLPPTIYLAQRLGDWTEAQPLIARVTEIASSKESGPIRKLTSEELKDVQSYAAQEALRLEGAYEQGVLPVHFLVGPLNLSLAWLLGPLCTQGRELGPEPQHPPIVLCHGGRGVPSPSDLPSTPKDWRLHLDTTALLVADALGILTAVEQLFAPLSVPQNLPVALIHIEELEELQRHSVAPAPLGETAAALDEKCRQERIRWIQTLRARLSRGIDRGIYQFLPESAGFRVYMQSLEEFQPPELLALVELLELEPASGNFVWIDDRLATSFLRSPGGLIVGITDLLAALEAYGGITREQRFEKLHHLRSAGARYIHLSSDELLHHLRSAPVEDGRVVETHELKALRRYFASCFADAELLQRPPVPEPIRNPHGEIWFLNSFDNAIRNTLLQIFEDERATKEECWARADFVWNNLTIVDLPSLLHQNRSEADCLTWLGLHVSFLLVRSALSTVGRTSAAAARGQDLLAWLEHRVMRTALRANPGLAEEIVRSLKESVLCTEEGDAPKGLRADVFRAFKAYFVDKMPERIRTLILADEEVLANLGDAVEPAVGFDEVVFSARKLWAAFEAASHGESVEVSTREGLRRFAVTKETQAAGALEVNLEELPKGIRLHLADPLLGLVSHNVRERCTLLTQHRAWLDHGEPERSTRIEQIALQPETWRRIEMVLEARKESAAWYYRELADTTRKSNIDVSELLPPSLDSLLRYHRFDRALAATDFPAALDQGARSLLVDEGVEEAVRRLAGLPVPLSTCLLEALAELDTQVCEDIVRRILGGPGSPVATFHLVRARLYLLGKTTVNSEAFAPLVEPLWDTTQLRWAEAFVTLMRWVDSQFDLWEEAFAAPVPLRLALVWSHAHQLSRAFAEIGVKPEGLRRAFSARETTGARSNFLHPNFSYLDDVAHPARVEPETLLFHGALFALDDRLPEGLASSEEDWWLSLTTNEVEGIRAARLPFLQAHCFGGNLLGSFLSWERWHNLSSSVAAPEPWFLPNEEFFHEKVRKALEQLGLDPNSADPWILLSAVVGTLLPPPEAAAVLASRLSDLDFVELNRRAPREAPGILVWAARIAPRLESPAASERIRAQILAAAEVVEKEIFTSQEPDADAASPEEVRASFLLEASRWASMMKGDPTGSAEQFASLVGRLMDAWPEISAIIRQAMERLSRTVPLDQAVRLRPLILRLRGKNI